MKSLPLILVLFLFNFGCDLETSNQQSTAPESTTTAPTQDPKPEEPAAPKAETNPEEIEKIAQNISVTTFNEVIKQAIPGDASWVYSPILTALKFNGEDLDCRHKTIDIKSLSGGETYTKVLVTITKDGFLDDSIRGDITFIRMDKVDGHWELTSAKKAWKCWKNRGHEEFNAEPCG